MLPLLRFAATLVRPLGHASLDPASTCVTRWRVLPNDIDLFGHMNNGRYQAIMDLGRIDFLRRCGLFAGVVRNRWIAPVGRASMVYRKPLKPFERYELHTRLVHWDERWFYFRQDFVRGRDSANPACVGHVSTLFVGRGGAVPTEHVVRELAGRDLEKPTLSDDTREVFRLGAATR